jgi:ribosomal protein L27
LTKRRKGVPLVKAQKKEGVKREGKGDVLLPSLTFRSSGGRFGSGAEVNQSSGSLVFGLEEGTVARR